MTYYVYECDLCRETFQDDSTQLKDLQVGFGETERKGSICDKCTKIIVEAIDKIEEDIFNGIS